MRILTISFSLPALRGVAVFKHVTASTEMGINAAIGRDSESCNDAAHPTFHADLCNSGNCFFVSGELRLQIKKSLRGKSSILIFKADTEPEVVFHLKW